MSPDILLKIENALRKSNLLNEADITLLCSKFKNYKSGDLLFPSVVKRHLGVSLQKAYEILNELIDIDVLKLCFEVQCGNLECREHYRQIFEEINEIPKWLTCEHCGYEFNLKTDVKVIFRVK